MTGYFKRKIYEIRQLSREPVVFLLVVGVVFVLGVFVVYPLFSVLKESLFVEDSTGISLANYMRFFQKRHFRGVLYNTLLISVIATIGALIIGTIFAYGMTRTNIPGKRFFMISAIIPMIAPPFLVAFSLILLFGRNGLINVFLDKYFGFKYIIYGYHGIIMAQIVSFFPLAYLITSATFASISPSLEDAAQDLGAREFHVLRTITLPLITPGILASMLLVFMSNVSSFGPPALLGGDISVLAVEAVIQTLGMMDWGMGTTICVVLLIPSLIVFQIQSSYKKGRSYVTVTGASSHTLMRKSPGIIKWPVFGFCLLISLFILLILGVIFIGGFTEVWGVNYSFSLRHFKTVFSHRWHSIYNSIFLSLIGSAFASIVGLTIAYLIVRRKFIGKNIMDFVATLPYAVPGTMMGLGFVMAFNKAPLILAGTAFIILLDFIIRRMPFGLRSGVSTLQQIDISLEEASADLGAKWGQTFTRVVLPLLKPAFVGGVTFAFIRAMTEITSTIFLVSPSWPLMAVDVYNYVMAGQLGAAAALSTLMMVMIVALIIVLYRVTGTMESLFKI